MPTDATLPQPASPSDLHPSSGTGAGPTLGAGKE